MKKQKHKGKKAADSTFKFRCHAADLESFRTAAESEGFNGNLTAWILWVLRRAARDAANKP